MTSAQKIQSHIEKTLRIILSSLLLFHFSLSSVPLSHLCCSQSYCLMTHFSPIQYISSLSCMYLTCSNIDLHNHCLLDSSVTCHHIINSELQTPKSKLCMNP